MKTKPSFGQRRNLLGVLFASMTVLTVSSQTSEPVPPPPPYPSDNREPANYPLPKTAREGTWPVAVTPQRFMSEAVWTGMRQVRLAEITARRTMNPEIRALAQSIGTDYSRLNSELRAVARRKGYEAPASDGLQLTNLTPNITSIRQHERLLGKVTPDTNANDRIRRDVLGDDGRVKVRDAESSRLSGQRTNDFSDLAASQLLVKDVRLLESATQSELDGMYLRMVRDEFTKSSPLFESAARQMEDAELQQFASATLLKLRDYEKRVQKLPNP